jgi:peptidoglycan hydrolase CwlO-like protein
MMKNLIVLSILFLSLSSCKDTEAENEAIAVQEQIALEKTADSLTMINREMDSLANSIQETSEEIDVLLNEMNNN